MRKLKINRVDFGLAFELSSYETTAYLDTETGAVLFVEDSTSDQVAARLTDEATLEAALATVRTRTDLSDTEREQMMDAARVEWDDASRYRMIPQQDSREGVLPKNSIQVISSAIAKQCSRSVHDRGFDRKPPKSVQKW